MNRSDWMKATKHEVKQTEARDRLLSQPNPIVDELRERILWANEPIPHQPEKL